MIDLRTTRRPVQDLIADSLSSFAHERPEVAWSSFALYACPWSGWILTSFDTESRSTERVAELAENGPDWYGEDAWGRFSNNCPDFQFHEWRLLSLDHWRDAYEAEEQTTHVRDLDGQDHFIDEEEGDEALNEPVFMFLRTVLLEEMEKMNADPSLHGARRRLGVQLLDSRFVEFWRLQPTAG